MCIVSVNSKNSNLNFHLSRRYTHAQYVRLGGMRSDIRDQTALSLSFLDLKFQKFCTFSSLLHTLLTSPSPFYAAILTGTSIDHLRTRAKRLTPASFGAKFSRFTYSTRKIFFVRHPNVCAMHEDSLSCSLSRRYIHTDGQRGGESEECEGYSTQL